MNTKLATQQIRTQQWAAIIQDCKSSGLKVDDYCQQHNLSRDQYYYWLRKVKEAALSQSGFVELSLEHTAPIAGASLIANVNGISLEIHENVSSELLAKVIGVLKNA